MSFHAEQFAPPPKCFLQSTGRLRWIQKRFSDLPLVQDGEPDNLRIFNGPAGRRGCGLRFPQRASAARKYRRVDALPDGPWFAILAP